MGKWITEEIGGKSYEMLNLDHSELEDEVIEEMDSGFKVYYDARWRTTRAFTEWLSTKREYFEGKRVLVVGAGIGEEALVLAEHSEKLWLNDLSGLALKYNLVQLEKNGLSDGVELLVGKCQELELPEVDLMIGCFLVYEKETLAAISELMAKRKAPLMLMNEYLPAFVQFCRKFDGDVVFEIEGAQCVLYK